VYYKLKVEIDLHSTRSQFMTPFLRSYLLTLQSRDAVIISWSETATEETLSFASSNTWMGSLERLLQSHSLVVPSTEADRITVDSSLNLTQLTVATCALYLLTTCAVETSQRRTHLSIEAETIWLLSQELWQSITS